MNAKIAEANKAPDAKEEISDCILAQHVHASKPANYFIHYSKLSADVKRKFLYGAQLHVNKLEGSALTRYNKA